MTFEIDGSHYKQDYQKVETMYEYKYDNGGRHNAHHPFRGYEGYPGFGGYGDDDGPVWGSPANTTGTPHTFPSNVTEMGAALREIAERRRNSFTPAKTDVRVSFSDYAVKYLEDFWINPSDTSRWLGDVHELKKKDGRVYLEIYDYIPANYEPGCTSWFIYGAPIHPRSENLKVIVYWMVHNKTKDQIKEEMDTNPFWHVRIGEVNTNQFNAEVSYGEDGVKILEKRAIVKAYGNDAKSAYEVMNGDEATQTATH
jgi:hypothetical protein